MKRYLIASATLFMSAMMFFSCNKNGLQEEVVADFEGDIETAAMVDLGLSVKWASCNVGAESPEQSGTFFACGQSVEITDDVTKDSYTYEKTTDPVTDLMGAGWRMPTASELKELADLTVEKARYNGKVGYVVTSNGGYSIFFPCTGYKTAGKIHGNACEFWYDGATETGGDLALFYADTDTTWTVKPSQTKYTYVGLPLRGVHE